MKILHIVWSSNIGGIESLVFNLSNEQILNKNLFVTIFTAKSDGPLCKKINEAKIPLIKGNFKKGSLNLKELQNCISIFKEFDVLHMHSFNPIIALAAIKSKKRIIYTEHGNFGFQRNQNILEIYSRKILKYFLNNSVDYITFNSNFSEKTAKARYGLQNVKSKVIYNGTKVISTNFDRKNKPVNSKIIIGTVGRLVNVKRIDRLINAFANIENKDQFELKIIGDGPLKDSLIELSKTLQIEKYITFMGFRNDLQDQFKLWDFLIMSSIGEAFGLVVLEAYQSGLPTIIFEDGGGMVEIVAPNDPELIVKNEKELSKLLSDLPSKITYFNETKKVNQRILSANEFSISKMEKLFEEIYISI